MCRYLLRKLILTSFFLQLLTTSFAQINYARDLVNPFIGTGGHGHTFPGACVPFGLVQLSPDTRPDGVHDRDGASGYHYSDSIIYGFSHTHLSGTDVSDLCDVLLMPMTGEPSMDPDAYRATFRKETEAANAGYYRVHLDEPDVLAELTATSRVGVHRYTYPAGLNAALVLDLEHRDYLEQGSIVIVSETEVVGERRSSSWAKDQRLFYCMRFSKPMQRPEEGLLADRIKQWQTTNDAFNFGDLQEEPLIVKVGISAVSIEGARANLEAEMPHWDFDRVLAEAEAEWNKALGKIKVEGGTREEQRIFYTALYHTMTAPYIFNDVDGNYRGMDGQVHHADHDVYTVFNLRNTFRALHPLLGFLEPDRTRDFMSTILLHYEHSARLPVWELWGNETDHMIGYHSASVILDGNASGIWCTFDHGPALEAMVATADLDHFGLDAYERQGYISSEDEPGSVSKTLEYAYDDWCIAVEAETLGEDSIAKRFYDRSRNWQNLYDPQTGFLRARRNGGFVEPFDPYEVSFHYSEANAWQYSLFVPHDMDRFIALIGGRDALTQRLDALFTAREETTGGDRSNNIGMIGQYAHGNGTSHSYAWLYNQSSRPSGCEIHVHNILKELYADAPDGLAGNEGCGQMSAWYVLSALGMYRTFHEVPEWTVGKPLFNKVEIDLGGTYRLHITTEGKGPYIESITWNDEELERFRTLTNAQVVGGGELHFVLGPRPGSAPVDPAALRPETASDTTWRPVPIIKARSASFTDTLTITILSSDPAASLDYSMNDGPRIPYRNPFIIHESATIHAYDGNSRATAHFHKVEEEFSLLLESEPASQYMASGPNALIDGLRGGSDFRTGDWQGFEAQDVIATIDLGRPRKIERVGLGVFQDQRSRIWFPEQVEFAFSTNQRQWSSEFATHDVGRDEEGVIVRDLMTGPIKKRARYIKVIATNTGPCPEWHPAAGTPSWIFADEVLIHLE